MHGVISLTRAVLPRVLRQEEIAGMEDEAELMRATMNDSTAQWGALLKPHRLFQRWGNKTRRGKAAAADTSGGDQ